MRASTTRRQAGLSLIELLVTTVIAGIVFAAMVPFFVSANSKNTSDSFRNLAATIAQDKIERVRALDYESITQANLDSATFAGGTFGNTATVQSGVGTTAFAVKYIVDTQPPDAGPLVEQYKDVSVQVSWTAPPPVPTWTTPQGRACKGVVLVTRIYRQWAGPSVALDVSPAVDSTGMISNSSSIVLTATVPNNWVLTTSYVNFAITEWGVAIDNQDIKVTDLSLQTNASGDKYQYLGNGQYRFTWVGATTATPDVYEFTAVGYSSVSGQAGEPRSLYGRLGTTVPVTAPTGLTAHAGVAQAWLSWDPCWTAGFDHFEVYRSTVSGTFGGSPIATTSELGYADATPALNPSTVYYYQLKAVTTAPATSSPCPQVSARTSPSPTPSPDTNPPTTPTLAAAKITGTSRIALTWTAAVDSAPPTPPSGLAGYAILRSADGVTWGAPRTFPAAADTTWTDTTAGWNATWYYKVTAYDAMGNSSTSAVASAATGVQPTHTLTINNKNASNAASVWVTDLATGLYYTTSGVPTSYPPSSPSLPKSTGQATFANLPASLYNVYANFGGTMFSTGKAFSADLSSANASINIQ